MKKLRIRLLWHPQAQFAGYHIAEQMNLAREAGAHIVCEPIRFDQSGTEALLSGDVQMAVASPSHLLESRCPVDLRFILAIQQESSLVYPVRVGSGIESVADLRDRRVGVWPGHEDLELRWMLLKAGVADGAVERIPLSNTVTPFLAGEIDCAQMTAYHELHQAEEAAGHDRFRVFTAAPLGASLLKDGLLVHRNWIERNRDLVQVTVNAILQGWTLAFTNEEVALDACSRARPDMSRTEHARQLRDIRVLSLRGATLTHGLGYPDPQHIEHALRAMHDLGIPTAGLPGEDAADTSFWHNAPAEWRSASWTQD
jgi:ABC-type nitrate/sulfonate/bicarbonate transport system substrate-binding protein